MLIWKISIFALVLSVVFMQFIPFQNAYSINSDNLPIWLETNVKWWDEGKISDVEFFNGIKWLIEKEIITIPQQPPEHPIPNKILKIKESASITYVQEIIEKCGNNANCSSIQLGRLIPYADQNTILKTYYDLLDHYKQTNLFCHPHAHVLGEFLYDYLQNVTQAIELTDPVMCGGSTLHGIVENHINSQHIFSKTNPSRVNISNICPHDKETTPTIARWECVHGIGHGLAKIYGYDVFSSSERCNEFEQSWERTSCSKGLFMANVGNYYKKGIGTIDEENLFFPCNVINEKFAPPCYHYQSRHLLIQNNNDFKAALQSCDSVPKFAKYCIRGLGNAMADTVHSNHDFSDLCLTIHTNFQSDCYKGIVMKFADNRSIKEALEFCNVIPDEFQPDCYGEVGKWIGMVYLTHHERLEACLVSNNLKNFETCIKTNFSDLPIL